MYDGQQGMSAEIWKISTIERTCHVPDILIQ